ncbi:hypothetical protein [Herbaspirillum seropedicae]|uniref:PcRGLX/YetA-like N-terminal RIFT barrel domain-containing protein n=2 Tax=Herbaspirillum seropedicae TaxID=964 RepID=D8IYS1_HERSS|nr:hypothetical protein [Herbaspirillum seropedicae]ADJ64256.1 hypothetical protein Hsero_2760 [Herbaspirillum seropedicae SmR1]
MMGLCQEFRQLRGSLLLLAWMTLPGLPPAQAASADTIPSLPSVRIENTARTEQKEVALTFGQVFKPGDFKRDSTVRLKLADGQDLPLQLDIKARHADGSVRHAILSTVLPVLGEGQPLELKMEAAPGQPAQSAEPGAEKARGKASSLAAERLKALLAEPFDASVAITIDGRSYRASPRPGLQQGAYRLWLDGAVVTEWLVNAPLLDAQNRPHPHLQVRYAIRDYGRKGGVRIDVTVENDWAFEAAPGNFSYDVHIDLDGHSVYDKSGLTHYHHTRWRKVFWRGTAPQVNVRSDTAYLIASRALPNYDRSSMVAEKALRDLASAWTGPKTEPMGAGVANPAMPTTGGRPDIGLLPGWNVLWLLSMDRRAREASLGTGDLAGSWSIHYRDRSSDRPVSLARFPALTLLGQPGDARNPRTGKSEAFPPCQGCSNPNIADSAHMPAMNYLPYLLTGDYYQLEELQFWATWAVFKSNPAYRGYAQGLVHRSQVRDQAWTLRSLGQAAYITPDDDALKKELQDIVKNNLDWYTAQYVNNSQANRLGIIVDNAIVYQGNTGIAPWMDDFFTSSIGYLNDLGYQEALPLLRYKAAFPVARMTHPGYCWIFGAAYSIPVRPDQNAPLYTDLGQAYQAMLAANYRDNAPALAQTACASDAMAQLLKLRGGEMTGYSSQPAGFPSNLQPALAYSVDSDAPGARQAWERFMRRSVKPDYGLGPQFSVMPRTAGKSN